MDGKEQDLTLEVKALRGIETTLLLTWSFTALVCSFLYETQFRRPPLLKKNEAMLRLYNLVDIVS